MSLPSGLSSLFFRSRFLFRSETPTPYHSSRPLYRLFSFFFKRPLFYPFGTPCYFLLTSEHSEVFLFLLSVSVAARKASFQRPFLSPVLSGELSNSWRSGTLGNLGLVFRREQVPPPLRSRLFFSFFRRLGASCSPPQAASLFPSVHYIFGISVVFAGTGT